MRTHLTRYSLCAALLCAVLALVSRADTFTVTTTDDTDDGKPYDPAKPLSLRKAIRLANETPGRDTIVFDIPAGGGVATIVPFLPLPAITDSVVIDGYSTQNGAQPNTDPLGDNAALKVELNGRQTADDGTSVGLFLSQVSNCEIRGLIINGFADAMIYLSRPANDNVIAGNWIGLHADGVTRGGRVDNDGISVVGGSGNRIGGTVPADRNVISGNGEAGRISDVGQVGVRLFGHDASNNIVVGNFIGTDISGRNPVPNQGGGISIQASANLVGNGTPAGRNIISGNENDGVVIWAYQGNRNRNNVVAGNYIGLGVDDSVEIPNGAGVAISDADENTIGGTQPGDANVISGNMGFGIAVTTWYTSPLGVYTAGTSASSNLIQRNLIGTDFAGLQDRGNYNGGIFIDSADGGLATGNRIGGTDGSQRLGNVIAANKGNGIQFTGAGTTNNFVVGNFIGVDKTGAGPLGNNGAGVVLGYLDSAKGSAAGNLIGGIDPLGLAGNVIGGNQLSGVSISFGPTATAPSGGGHLIQGNLIGTDVTGSIAITNWGNGVLLLEGASDCLIGGTDPGARNVISGNRFTGVALMGSLNQSNHIIGNLIGTDINGTNAIPNVQGVVLGSPTDVNGAIQNTIGGLTAAERNVISGNAGTGILFLNGSSNSVLGNYVGVDRTGVVPLGNNGYGVWLMAKTNGTLVQQNRIGGPQRGAGNLICGNGAGGVVIEGTNAIGNVLQGNFIGTDPTGTMNLGNPSTGIHIDNAIDSVIGTDPRTSPSPGEANWIANNGGYGVQVTGDLALGNCIRGNQIADNASAAIVLGNGPEAPPNDPGDADVGPNELMNYPTLVSTNYDATSNQSAISGWVDTKDPTKVKVDLYTVAADSSVATWAGIGYLATEQPDTLGWFCHFMSGPVDPKTKVVATATSPRGSTSSLSPIPTLRLRALEVNQSVQDWSNSVPVLRGKKTYVRVYLETLDGQPATVSLDDLNPRLHGARNGQELSGGPQKSIMFGNLDLVGDASTVRGNLASSVNFQLPPDWCDGQLTLWFSGKGVTCGETVLGSAGTVSCKECGATVVFQPAPRLELEIVDVSFSVCNKQTNYRTNYYRNAGDDLDLMPKIIKAMYPVSQIDLKMDTLRLGLLNRAPEPGDVNKRLDTVFGSVLGLFSNRKTLGLIPGGDIPEVKVAGEAADIGSRVASSYYTLPFGRYRVAPAHELGHALGSHHAIVKLVECTDKSGNVIPCGQCGEDKGDKQPPNFPYDGDRPSLGPMNSGPDAMVFGLDTSVGAFPNVMDPKSVFELMSYCMNDLFDSWISATNYSQFINYETSLYGVESAVTAKARLQAGADDSLVLRGTVNLWAGTVEFTPFSRWLGPVASWTSQPGEYQLQLLGADGTTRFTTTFQPTRYDIDSPVQRLGGFIIPVKTDPAYRAARVQRRGVVLATRTASPNAPVVTSLTPNGGEVINDPALTIAWAAQDADGDTLTYDVQFSPDGGSTWTGLEADLPQTQLVVDRTYLPGTAKALVRVIASDGFNTAVRASTAVFTLPDLPPRLRILSPTPAQLFRRQQQIAFEAFAQDPEDGWLDGTNVVWQSDRNGVLGQGATLLYDAATLDPGRHQIGASAFDHLGQSVSASVSIMVGTNVPSSYADLSLQMAVSPAVPGPGTNFTLTLQVHNAGRDWATTVHLTNSLPPDLTLVSVAPSQGSWKTQNGLIVASLGDIEPQADATVAVVVVAAQAGTYASTATVGGPQTDPLPANNTATQVVTITEPAPAQPDLVVAILESPTNAPVGGTGDYLITVVNAGEASASQVGLTNWLPTGVTFLSAEASTGGQWAVTSNQVIAQFASLPVGGQAWLRLHVRVDSSDPLFDKATAFAAEDDAEPLDNVATSIVTFNTGPLLDVSRDAAGVRIEWADGSNLVLEQTDRLGPGAQWVSAQDTPVLEQGRWHLVIQPAAQTRFYRLRQL